jgi:nucleoside-diphosphate-sugar epimerase
MKTVLVTGATGFVGTDFCRRIQASGWQVRAALRSPCRLPEGIQAIEVGEIGPETNWDRALKGVDAVVHLGARVHVMQEVVADPITLFRRVNAAGTARLASEAARAGVRRLVFVSSIKVNGEGRWEPYSEADRAAPQDAYAVSKWEAELALEEIGRVTGMEWVILRVPLVYGPGVRGNFLRLLRLIQRGVPIPVGSGRNLRSLLFVGNLSDALCACLSVSRVANQTLLLSDGDDCSVTELTQSLALAMQRSIRILPVPIAWLRAVGRVTGRSAEVGRLIDPLRVDSTRSRELLGWRPPYTLEQGLTQTADWFVASGSK